VIFDLAQQQVSLINACSDRFRFDRFINPMRTADEEAPCRGKESKYAELFERIGP
jgi:hypothetical protein